MRPQAQPHLLEPLGRQPGVCTAGDPGGKGRAQLSSSHSNCFKPRLRYHLLGEGRDISSLVLFRIAGAW